MRSARAYAAKTLPAAALIAEIMTSRKGVRNVRPNKTDSTSMGLARGIYTSAFLVSSHKINSMHKHELFVVWYTALVHASLFVVALFHALLR